MYIQRLHSWPEAYHEALELQKQLKSRVRIEPLRGPVRRIAGADVSYSRRSKRGFGAVVILTFPELEMVESAAAEMEVTFPYIPGLLTFREAPVLLKAFEKLQHVPDVVIFDGQGIAHPQGMGLATHMGLWLGLPAIGCGGIRTAREGTRRVFDFAPSRCAGGRGAAHPNRGKAGICFAGTPDFH